MRQALVFCELTLCIFPKPNRYCFGPYTKEPHNILYHYTNTLDGTAQQPTTLTNRMEVWLTDS